MVGLLPTCDTTHRGAAKCGRQRLRCTHSGYAGVEKREGHAGRQVIWQVAARRSTYKQLYECTSAAHCKRPVRTIEKAKAQLRAKVEHRFE